VSDVGSILYRSFIDAGGVCRNPFGYRRVETEGRPTKPYDEKSLSVLVKFFRHAVFGAFNLSSLGYSLYL
jgi:hypothetical protein